MTTEDEKEVGRRAVMRAKEDGCASLLVLCELYHQSIVEYQSHLAEELAEEARGNIITNQFRSKANPDHWVSIYADEVAQAVSGGFEVRKVDGHGNVLT